MSKIAYIKKHSLNVVILAASVFMFMFGIWQHDLICCPHIWRPGVMDQYFQCWIWKTTIGQAYDITLFVEFIAFWLLFLSLWFWEDS